MTQAVPYIPTISEALASLPAPTEDQRVSCRKLAEEHGRMHALHYALMMHYDDAADAVMQENGWTPRSRPKPDQGNWHKDCSIIYYGCWGNSKESSPGEMLQLYDYCVRRDPGCVYTPAPQGNMLHAWCYNPRDLSILRDLLTRGVDPTAKNNDDQTPLDMLKRAAERDTATPEKGMAAYASALAARRAETIAEINQRFGAGSDRANNFIAELTRHDAPQIEAGIKSGHRTRAMLQTAMALLVEAEEAWRKKAPAPPITSMNTGGNHATPTEGEGLAPG